MATDLLTAVDYWRLAKIYPFKAEFEGEARYITEQRRDSTHYLKAGASVS